MTRIPGTLPDPERWRFWLSITLVLKGATLFLLLHIGAIGMGDAGMLGVWWSDAPTYFEPIDSLLAGGDYLPDLRLPGYGVVYFLVRLFTEPPLTYDVLVVLQTLVAAFSMYVLPRSVYRITGSKALFLATLLLYAASISVHWYDAVMLTESLCASSMIFFIDRWERWYRTGSRAALVFSGLWLTWAIFLKPVIAPVFALALIALWMARAERGAFLRNALLILAPLILLDGAWILRNAIRYGEFSPIARRMYTGSINPTPEFRATQFVIAFGGDCTWWTHPNAEIRFFNVGHDQLPGATNASSIVLPERIMTSIYNVDTLRATSVEILALKDPAVTNEFRDTRNKLINARFERWTEAFIKEHPVQYHFLTKLIALRRFVVQTGNPVVYAQTFREMPWYLKATKLFHLALHWATLLGGFVGGYIWLRRGPSVPLAILPVLIVPFGTLVFSLVLRLSEHRYLVPFIPVMLLCTIVGYHYSRNRTT
jgi:hypothetical protein